MDIGEELTCSAGSVAVGDQRFATVQIPGTLGCAFEQAYEPGHPSLARPHRLQVQLRAAIGDGRPEPHILGWSLPWLLGA